MAHQEHLRVFRQGVNAWNTWRSENPGEKPDLTGLRMKKADLSRIDLSKSQLAKADLRGSHLWSASLAGADLSDSRLVKAYLVLANLSQADLRKAKLCGADFRGADLSGADLRSADLQGANLSETKLHDTDLSGSRVYGVSAWNLHTGSGTVQRDLVITRSNEPTITVDSLEVAQFIHMLTNNRKIREVIDTVTSKVVLILGSFHAERKHVLDALHVNLQDRDYVPCPV